MGKASIRVLRCFFLILCNSNLIDSNGVRGIHQGGTDPAENEEQRTDKPLLLHGYSTQNRRAKSNGNGNTAGGVGSGNEANEVENETTSGGQGSKPLPRPNNYYGGSGLLSQGAYNDPYYYDMSSWNDRSMLTSEHYASDFGMQNTWNDGSSGHAGGHYDNGWNDGFTTTTMSPSQSNPYYPDIYEDN